MVNGEIHYTEGVISIIPQFELGTKFYGLYNNCIIEYTLSQYEFKLIHNKTASKLLYEPSKSGLWTNLYNRLSSYFTKKQGDDNSLFIKYIVSTYNLEDGYLYYCYGDLYIKRSNKGDIKVFLSKQEAVDSLL
jgi:hypothetical protein